MNKEQTSISPSLMNYYRDSLTDAIDHLVVNHEIPRLSSIFSDFVYFLSHPECAPEFEKQSILDHATECINLLGTLHDVYDKYEDYKHPRQI